MDSIKTFKISSLSLQCGLFTSSIVYLTLSNMGEFTAFFADNSIKLTGLIGSNVVKIVFGDIASSITSVSTNKLAEYINTNIKTGSHITALGISTIAGFITIILTIIGEFIYSKTRDYINKININFNESDFSIETVDDFEIITLTKNI